MPSSLRLPFAIPSVTCLDPRTNVRAKLALVLAAMGIALALLATAAYAVIEEQRAERDAHAGLEKLGERLAATLERDIEERRQDVEAIAGFPVFTMAGGYYDKRKVLSRVRDGHFEFEGLGYAGRDGEVIVDTNWAMEAGSVRDAGWFRSALVGTYYGPAWSPTDLPAREAGDAQATIALIAVPVPGADQRVHGVLYARLARTWVERRRAEVGATASDGSRILVAARGEPYRDELATVSVRVPTEDNAELAALGLDLRVVRRAGNLSAQMRAASRTMAPFGAAFAFLLAAIGWTIAGGGTVRRESPQEIARQRAEIDAQVGERTAELNATVAELECFNHSVSHDLRAPLRAVAGFARILEEEHAHALDDAGRHYLGRIAEAASGMEQLLDGLLALSRVTREPLLRRPVPLGRIAKDIAHSLADANPPRAVRFDIDESIEVTGDARLLSVALENLLTNSWKFTGREAEAHIRFGRSPHDPDREFFVADNGVGFDMLSAGRLFTPFGRLHSQAQFGGTGLGLATVARIVRRHGGAIRAVSAPGEGATFYFRLPSRLPGRD